MKKTTLLLIISLGLVTVLATRSRAALTWHQVTEVPTGETTHLYTYHDTLYSASGGLLYRFDRQENNWDTLAALDPEVNLLSGIIKVGDRLFAGTYTKGVFESDDNGLSWGPCNTGLTGLGSNDIGDLTNRGDSLYVGTFGAGISVMDLGGSSVWHSFRDGMPDNTASNILSVYNHDNYLISGAGFNSSIFRNAPNSTGWTEFPFSAFDPRGAGMLDMTSRNGLVYGAAGNGLYISHDSGATWERDEVTPHLIANGSVAADQDRVYASIFFVIYGAYYYTSTGNGWEVIDSVPGPFPFDLAVLGGRLYSARSDGLWYADLNPTSVNDNDHSLPDHFRLGQNYPNPFNPSTTIEFDIPERSSVTLEIFNLLGQSVRTLVDDARSAGKYVVAWDGTDNAGRTSPSGIYFYRLSAGGYADCRKMLLIK